MDEYCSAICWRGTIFNQKTINELQISSRLKKNILKVFKDFQFCLDKLLEALIHDHCVSNQTAPLDLDNGHTTQPLIKNTQKFKEIWHICQYSNKLLQLLCRKYPGWLHRGLVRQFQCTGPQEAAERGGPGPVHHRHSLPSHCQQRQMF